eukprot:2365225-Rhodomonas_salina.4
MCLTAPLTVSDMLHTTDSQGHAVHNVRCSMCLPAPPTVSDMLLATDSQGHAVGNLVTCCAPPGLTVSDMLCEMSDEQCVCQCHQQSVTCCTTRADSQGHAVGNVRCAMCLPVPQTVRKML